MVFEFLTIDDNERKNVPSQAAKKGVLAPFCIAKTLRQSDYANMMQKSPFDFATAPLMCAGGRAEGPLWAVQAERSLRLRPVDCYRSGIGMLFHGI